MPRLPKAPTGIDGLDEITEGGLPSGRPTLVCGSVGCGKTLLGIEFMMCGIQNYGEPGELMVFEETAAELAANVASRALSMNGLKFGGTQALAVLVTDVSAAQEIDDIWALVAEQNAPIDRAHDEPLRQQAARRAVEQVAAEVGRVLEGIPQIAWTSDPAGVTSCLNRRWFDFAGEGTTAESRPITDHLHPADLDPTVVRWNRSLATGEPLDVGYRIRNAAGHYRWTLGRALPLRDEDGGIGTFTDIHEQKLALERVAQAQLRAKNEQLTRTRTSITSCTRSQGGYH